MCFCDIFPHFRHSHFEFLWVVHSRLRLRSAVQQVKEISIETWRKFQPNTLQFWNWSINNCFGKSAPIVKVHSIWDLFSNFVSLSLLLPFCISQWNWLIMTETQNFKLFVFFCNQCGYQLMDSIKVFIEKNLINCRFFVIVVLVIAEMRSTINRQYYAR